MDIQSLHGQVATSKTQSLPYREEERIMIAKIQQILQRQLSTTTQIRHRVLALESQGFPFLTNQSRLWLVGKGISEEF